MVAVDNHCRFKFLSVRRRAGSSLFADFLPWKCPESVFLELIKSKADSGDEIEVSEDHKLGSDINFYQRQMLQRLT